MTSIRHCVGFVVMAVSLLPMGLSWSNQNPAGGKAANDSYNRGVEALNKNDFDQAIADFTEAIRLDPKLAPAYGGRGVSYAVKGEHDKAIADYTQVSRLNPLAAVYGDVPPGRRRAFPDDAAGPRP